jgi:hypothetical protein
MSMEKKYYPLEHGETGTFIKVIRVIFGIICIIVAIYWLVFSPAPVPSRFSLYIMFLFLTCFGFIQIWHGIGKAVKFIEFNDKKIKLKKNIFLPPVDLNADDIERIELFPMNTIFFLKSEKRIILRFGSMYQETNETIKDELISFSDDNNIPLEIRTEKI